MQDEMLSHWAQLPDKLPGDTPGQGVGVSFSQAGHLWTNCTEKVCLRTAHQKGGEERILSEVLFYLLSFKVHLREN